MREAASEWSERAPHKHIYFHVSPYLLHLHTHSINAVPLNYLWYGAIWQQYTNKTLTLRKFMHMRASFKIFTISHSKTGISSNILSVQMTCLSGYMYRQISKCTDKTPKMHYGGNCPPPPPPPPGYASDIDIRWCNTRIFLFLLIMMLDSIKGREPYQRMKERAQDRQGWSDYQIWNLLNSSTLQRD